VRYQRGEPNATWPPTGPPWASLSLSLSRSLTLAGPREWPAKGSNKGNKGNKGNINNNNNNKLLKAGARELRNLEAQSNSRSSAEQSRGGQR